MQKKKKKIWNQSLNTISSHSVYADYITHSDKITRRKIKITKFSDNKHKIQKCNFMQNISKIKFIEAGILYLNGNKKNQILHILEWTLP